MTIERFYTFCGLKVPFSRKELFPDRQIIIPEKGYSMFDGLENVNRTHILLKHIFTVKDFETIVFHQDEETKKIPPSFRKNYHPNPVTFSGDEINALGPFPTKIPKVKIVFLYKPDEK